MSGTDPRPETEVVEEATSFLRRLAAAGSEATVLSLVLADPSNRQFVTPNVAEPEPSLDDDGTGPTGEQVRPGWTAGVADELSVRLAPLIRSTDLLRQVQTGEFLLIVPTGGDLAGPALAERVRGVAALPFTTGSGTFSLVLHVGVASFSPDLEDPSIAIDAARADARGGR